MSHVRKPGESDVDFAKRRAIETGHLWSPDNVDGPNVKPADVATLTPQDNAIREAFRGFSRMMVRNYVPAFAAMHGTTPEFDGKLDSALLEVMSQERCDVPDYAPPPGVSFLFDDPAVQEVAEQMQDDYYVAKAIGSGNWPHCHAIGDFHCAVIQVDETNRPSWMTDAVFIPMLKQVVASYDALGLHVVYVNAAGRDYITGADRSAEHVDVKSSWVKSSSGWIGLAIVGQGIGCGEEIWQQFLNTYQGGQTDDLRIRQNTKLWMHEFGHNTGLPHSNGGIMNPSIMNDNRITWTGDPSEPSLVQRYGGQPYVPPGGPGPGPGPTPPPVTDIAARVTALERAQFEDTIKNAVQDARDQMMDARIKKLENAP